MTKIRITTLSALLILLAATIPAQAEWVISEIPMLPTWSGGLEAVDINSTGVVCGNGNYVINVSVQPYIYEDGVITELPLLPEANAPIALATAINSHRVVCGYSRNAQGSSRAVYWESEILHELPYPLDANTNSDLRAYDINDHGVIVGYYWSTSGERCAFYYKDGVSHSLTDELVNAGLPSFHGANAVNNRNVLCGTGRDSSGTTNAYTFDINTQTVTLIGRIGLDDCSAVAINNNGQTLGRGKFYPWDAIHRAVTYDGSWHFVDTTPTRSQWAGNINDKGRMVGNGYIAGGAKWSWYSDGYGDGSMVVLEPTDWPTFAIQSINEFDVCVGWGETTTSDGETRAFILAPPPGDYDHDGDVDLTDVRSFIACISGPVQGPGFTAPSSTCLAAFDSEPKDGDVDIEDFAALQAAYQGS